MKFSSTSTGSGVILDGSSRSSRGIMTTLKPTMNLMALLKAGATVEFENVKFRISRKMILIYRRGDEGSDWKFIGQFDATKANLERAIEYINLPF